MSDWTFFKKLIGLFFKAFKIKPRKQDDSSWRTRGA